VRSSIDTYRRSRSSTRKSEHERHAVHRSR
jgi:hypothetical protein